MYERYNWRLLRNLQGEPKKDQMPYVDDVISEGKTFQRIFISDEYFAEDFEKFKYFSDCAKAAHFLTDSYTGGYTRRSDALPLSENPRFLVERLPVGLWVCWLNVSISEPKEFQRILLEAHEKRDEVKKAYSIYRDAAFPMTKCNTVRYCSETNEPSDDYVSTENLLSVFGIN